jgi:pyruvate-formate lyase-activating enzyme
MTPMPLGSNPPGQHIAMMVTRRCNMTCGHCSVESGPAVRGEPSEAELLQWVRDAAAGGVQSIRFTGGEPMLRQPTILKLLRECKRLGVASLMTSNGFWGRTEVRARRQLHALMKAGLGGLTLSYDRYHAEFQGPDPMLHISNAAEGSGLPVRISLVRGTDEAELSDIVNRLEGSAGTRLRVYDLQPVGRARELPLELHRGEVEGLCTACSFPAVTDDGRVVACNGPSYFEGPASPLVLGSLRETSFAELIDRHRRDPILDTIRTLGPAGLRNELRKTPGFEQFPFRARYTGICDLCHHLTRSTDAMTALRARLARPEATAIRLAMWQVIDGNRQRGTLSASYVNGIGSARLFLGAALAGGFGTGDGAEQILGRADIDYRRLADYLAGSGLARPLLPVIDGPEMTRWTPQFFRDALRLRAVADSVRELHQRDAIQHMAAALDELGGQGILLKGAAFLLRDGAGLIGRSASDVDILVDPALAVRLRTHLLARGFEGSAEDGRSSVQHLAPIFYEHIPIEIHTRLMPSFWGLPEAQMIASARPVPGSDVLATLGPEALILHAGTHASAAFFSFGLKTAWDLLAVLHAEPAVDWDRLAGWVDKMRAPLGFWTSVRVLADDLGLPIPAAFLRHAPIDRGARRIALVARQRLFTATESIFDLDVITKAGLMLLLQDRWSGRARYLATKVSWRSAQPSTWGAATARARRADILRQAWRQYQRYRRSMIRARAIPQEAE